MAFDAPEAGCMQVEREGHDTREPVVKKERLEAVAPRALVGRQTLCGTVVPPGELPPSTAWNFCHTAPLPALFLPSQAGM
jgi:hypothetical protein